MSIRADWLRFPAEDRKAITKLIQDHADAVARRQVEYSKQHQDRDSDLVTAFKRRRAACKLAVEILSETKDEAEDESS